MITGDNPAVTKLMMLIQTANGRVREEKKEKEEEQEEEKKKKKKK